MKSSAVWGPQHKRPGRVFMVMALGVGITASSTQGQTISFFRGFSAPGMLKVTDVAADPSGVYVFGVTPALQAGGQSSAGVRKYDSRGNELWTREISAPTQGEIWISAAADAATTGVYVAAIYTSTNRGFVRKYSAEGSELWTRQVAAGALAVDASGVYVAGGNGPPDNTSFVRKYTTGGTELWTREVPGAFGLEADATGVYAVWRGSGAEAFVRKYNPSGSQLWTRQLDFHPQAVAAADPPGLFVTGSNETGSFLRKYDAAGNELWTRQGPDTVGLAADATGVYVAGILERSALPGQCRSASIIDSFVRKYDPTGAEVWTRQFGAFRGALASGLAVDDSGVYVAGETPGLFGLISVPTNVFLAKFEKAPAVVPASGPYVFPGCVVNAASYVGGGVAPGEIVTIFGLAMGPSELVPFRLTEDNRLATSLADTRILFNGVPAALLYVSERQSSAIVPYAVADGPSVDVRVEYKGVQSGTVTLPVLPSHLGIFSLDVSGQGQGVIFNEDGSLNSPSTPAQGGSIVTIYATGGGETATGVVDGQILGQTLPRTSLPVSMLFDIEDPQSFKQGEVVYAGGVSGSVAGLLELKVRLPPDVGAGDAVRLTFIIGSDWTESPVTMALR